MRWTNEIWKNIEYDTRYQVSNYGRFRKKTPKGNYRFLKPFRKNNLITIKIKDKDFNCARLVANAYLKKLSNKDRVFHKDGFEFNNYLNNLEIISLKELGKRTGALSKSKRVVELKKNEIKRSWKSARKAAKDLFVSYQTVMDYCNKKVKSPMFNLKWEDDYFEEELEQFNWKHKKGEANE